MGCSINGVPREMYSLHAADAGRRTLPAGLKRSITFSGVASSATVILGALAWIIFMLWIFGVLPKRVPRIPFDRVKENVRRWASQWWPQKTESEMYDDASAPSAAFRRQAQLAAELRAAKGQLKGRGSGVAAERTKARIRVLEKLQISARTCE
ncbi:hypothetical protein FB45DRAFT_908853 [Roridomyces roridus]|uniref:Uncharacterized protein n=1 Tax=Roridomyces roridus TaxID=1738132 RepID=A0AAD7FRW5_9AGAR|nr:hypothetical protein FB45DRAFT_908853 [Roridomyces roridus]